MAADARFPDPLSPESKGSFRWLRCCSIFFLVGVLLIIATILGVRWYFNRLIYKDMSPEEIAEMDRFFEEPIGIPEAWQQVEPYSFELIEAAENVRTQWEGLSEPPALVREWLDSKSPPTDEWETIEQSIKTDRPKKYNRGK